MRYRDSVNIMLKKSQGSYSSAVTDISNGIIDRAVSSLYYSVFQMVTALMLQNGVTSKSHTQTRAYVNRELVLKGLISIQLGKMYNRLMDMRADADYSDAITFSTDQVKNIVEEVQVFNQTILELIHKGNVGNE